LIGEEILDPGDLIPDRTIAYTYDDVGNRLTRNDSAEGVTTYSYDEGWITCVLDGWTLGRGGL